MPGISRVNLDTAVGTLITPPIQTFCLIEGYPAAILNQKVTDHGAHTNVVIPNASDFCFCDGVGIVYAGIAASCDANHKTTGSSVVFINI